MALARGRVVMVAALSVGWGLVTATMTQQFQPESTEVSGQANLYHACLRAHSDEDCYVWNQPQAIARLLGWPLEDAINAEHELTFAGLIHWRWIPGHDRLRIIHCAPMRPTTPPGHRVWEIR